MEKKHLKWNSPSLGKYISFDVYGNGGTPILLFDGFPQYASHQYRETLLSGLKLQIENGYNLIYCLNLPSESDIMNIEIEPSGRLISYNFFEEFILDEVIPRIKKDSEIDYLILIGVNSGCYHATNLMFKHPDKFNKLIAVCGPVDLRPFFGSYFSQDLYYNNPTEFLPNLNDEVILSSIRANDLRLVSTKYDEYHSQFSRLSELLSNKYIDHHFDVWEENNSDAEVPVEMLKKHVP